MKTSLTFAAGVVILIGTAAYGQKQQQMVVPAFFDIGDPSNGWARIEAAGSAVQIVVPGWDTLSNVSTAQAQFVRLRQNYGQIVLGYIDSGDCVNPCQYDPTCVHQCTVGRLTLTKENVMFNVSQRWVATYLNQIDGIFFDDGPYLAQGGQSESEFQTFYTYLYSHTRGYSFGAAVPNGAHRGMVMLNASAFPNPWVVTGPGDATGPAADYATIVEISKSAYVSNYSAQTASGSIPPPDWWSQLACRGTLAHVVYNASSSDVSQVVNLSQQRGYPSLYIHDSNGYGHLSSLFETTIAAVPNCPDPSTVYCGNTICGGKCYPVGYFCPHDSWGNAQQCVNFTDHYSCCADLWNCY